VEVAILPCFARRESGCNSGTVLAIDFTMALAVLLSIIFVLAVMNMYYLARVLLWMSLPL
jgi:hypothetical protein